MLKFLVLSGLVGTANAAPYDDDPRPRVERRGPFSNTPIKDIQDEREQEKSEEQKELEERRRKLQAARSQLTARVVVLQERITDIDYTNETLIRNIRNRIARPDARFYPDVDLYQAGRKEPDRTLRPLDQRASVPDDVIDRMNDAWRSVAAIPWNALDETTWGERAAELKSLADSVWFVDRPELRAPLFNLYVQIGRAAENSNNPIPPYFEQVALQDVNYYYYLAAAMAHRTPGLMSELDNPETYTNVENLRSRLDAGEFAPMTLNFELGGEFEAEAFLTEYKTYFNGITDDITNDQALYDVPPGRMDIFLERPGDGYGMSVSVKSIKVDDQDLESPRDQARKRMGIDFIEQLMKNPEQCIPDVEGDILNYLAIYSKLHDGAEIYIAVPEAGSVHKIFLWKWVPDQGTLIRINDNTGGFPVRFVGLAGAGMAFNGASVKDPVTQFITEAEEPITDLGAFQTELGSLFDLQASAVPFGYELRGHYNRLMVSVSMEAAASLQDGWREIANTRTAGHSVSPDGEVTTDRILLTETGDNYLRTLPYVKENSLQRGLFATVGGVLGPDAAYGFGPRAALRFGHYNAPHSLDLTAHLGWSIVLTGAKKEEEPDSRVHGILDTDLYAGAIVPYGDTYGLLVPVDNGAGVVGWAREATEGGVPCTNDLCGENLGGKVKIFDSPRPNFGFAVKAGLTF